MIGFITKEQVEWLREKYPEGTRIVCDYMDDEHPVEKGTKGIVKFIDDIGTIHVSWENGRSLGLVFGLDSFHTAE